jgi:hypothetical protein
MKSVAGSMGRRLRGEDVILEPEQGLAGAQDFDRSVGEFEDEPRGASAGPAKRDAARQGRDTKTLGIALIPEAAAAGRVDSRPDGSAPRQRSCASGERGLDLVPKQVRVEPEVRVVEPSARRPALDPKAPGLSEMEVVHVPEELAPTWASPLALASRKQNPGLAPCRWRLRIAASAIFASTRARWVVNRPERGRLHGLSPE